MSLVSNLGFNPGDIFNGLTSAAATFYLGRKGLDGLFKASVVMSRFTERGLRFIGFRAEDPEAWGTKYITSYVPQSVSNFLSVTNAYNGTHDKTIQVPKRDKEGKVEVDSKKKPIMIDEVVQEWDYSNLYLLSSGVALSMIALIGLELKSAYWRVPNPLLNTVLTHISPFRLIVGETWVTDGLRYLTGRALSAVSR